MGSIDYGVQETVDVIDANGSTLTIEEKYQDGVILFPRRKRFEIRHKVANEDDVAEKFRVFLEDVTDDNSKLDPLFKIEGKHKLALKGHYFVVCCWTVLERQ